MASSTPALGAFPSPFSIQPPPDCAGWEAMYPYYALFDEHRRETDENRQHRPGPAARLKRAANHRRQAHALAQR